MVATESGQQPRELSTDKPTRSYSSSRNGARHAPEPPHAYPKLEKHRFTSDLAETLEAACTKEEFAALVLVLPRRSLGELRGLLSKKVQKRVRREIAKDLTNETAAALLRHLAPQLRSSFLTVRPSRL